MRHAARHERILSLAAEHELLYTERAIRATGASPATQRRDFGSGCIMRKKVAMEFATLA